MNERPPILLYHQIYVILREKILSGEYEKGDFFPSEQELSTSLRVSRVTVRRALDLLEQDHLIRRAQGRSTLIAPGVTARPVTANIAGQLDNALALGRQTRVELLQYGDVVPRQEIAAALNLPFGKMAHMNVRVRLLQDAPVSHVTTFLPQALGKKIRRQDLLSSKPVLSLVEREMPVEEAEQAIGATLADGKTSAALKVPIGAPLLEVRRLCYARGRMPIMITIALYNPDYYQYRLKLTRNGPDADVERISIHD
jgi:GntR family transcriptional regulator